MAKDLLREARLRDLSGIREAEKLEYLLDVLNACVLDHFPSIGSGCFWDRLCNQANHSPS